LRRKRRDISVAIRKRLTYLRNRRVDEVTEHLEKHKGDRRCFEAMRLLRKSEFKKFRLEDEQCAAIYNPKQTIPLVEKYYEEFFRRDNALPIKGF
jgi:hypothetical protein